MKVHDHSKFLDSISKSRGKPLSQSEIVYVKKDGGNGVGIIIDGRLYDLEAISEKVEVQL